MKTTYASVLTQVRRQIKDEAAELLDDATVQGVIVDAIRELGTTHPDALLNEHGTKSNALPEHWPEGDTNHVDNPVDEYYVPALAALSLAKLHLRDGLDTKDEALGNFWLRRYAELAGG